jgi:cobalt-zinc-cadmium efflux system membrane fusion protein
MKYQFLVTALAAALSACGRKPEDGAAHAADQALTQTVDGVIAIPPDSPKLKQVRVEAVKTAEVPTSEVDCPGKVELNPNHVARIALPVPGRVSGVAVRIGDHVMRGQPVLTIDSSDADAAESAYLQSEGGLTQAKSTLSKAQADYERSTDLFQHNAVAKKDVLASETALVQAKAAVQQAEAGREQAFRKLALLGVKPGEFGQKIVVRAPVSGKVLDLTVVPGEYRNDTTAPVMTIADLSSVWVSSDVPETAIRMIRVGERVDVRLAAYPADLFRARVARIADTVDPQTRTIKVHAEMDNRGGRLRPEMFGSIRHTEGSRTLPAVPAGAVIQEENRNFVFVEVAPGKFRQTEVQIGLRSGDMLPVTKGITAGDRIVTDGAMLLKTQ